MGIFSSKKKTFSGVGSAVQNLLSGEVENFLATTVVSANINKKDLGETFQTNLESGAGIKLRQFIDYAENKGYNKLLNWETSGLNGEMFSNSNEYANYLASIVYPSKYTETKTEPVIISETRPQSSSYLNGFDYIETKTFTRIKEFTKTSENTIHNINVDTYYQGSNTGFLALDSLFTGDNADLAELIDPTNISLYTDTFATIVANKVTFTNNKITVIFLPEEASKDLAVTSSGTVILALNSALNTPNLSTVEKSTDDEGNEVITEVSISGSDVFIEEYNNLAQIKQDIVDDPITTLKLNNTQATIQTVNVGLFIQAYCQRTYTETAKTEDSSEESEDPKLLDAESKGVWLFGKAVIITSQANNTSKALIASSTIETIQTKTVTITQTEYEVTEKYRNGLLESSSEQEGSSTSESSSETLVDKTITHKEKYSFGLGNSYLDAILSSTKNLTETFCPILPIKTWGELCSKSWGDLYTTERKLYRKLSGKTLNKWDDFVESFEDVGDDAKMIYYWPSVPINVDEDYSNEYLFHFFKWLAVNFGGTGSTGTQIHLIFRAKDNSANTEFHVQYKFQVYYQMYTGSCPVDCKAHHYKRNVRLSTTEPDDSTTYQWKGKFEDFDYNNFIPMTQYNNTASFEMKREDYPNLTDEEYETLVFKNKFTLALESSGSTQLAFYYKVSDNVYEKVLVNNFIFWHFVRGAPLVYYLKSSLKRVWTEEAQEELSNEDNAGFAPIVIPIARGALASMGWYRQTGLLQVCHNVIIAGYQQQTIKVKWYQRGIFQIVLIIVIIVVSIYSMGTGAAAAGSAGATASSTAVAGASAIGTSAISATLASLATMAIKSIAIAILANIVSTAANKYIGGTFGAIVGAVAAVAVVMYGSYQLGLMSNSVNTSFWESMNTWKGYSTLTQATIDNTNQVLNTYNQQQSAKFQEQYTTQLEDQESKQKELQKFSYELNSWGNDNLTDIIVNSTYTSSNTASNSYILAEDPDTFFYRIFDLDYIDLNNSYIEDFVDYINNLNFNT